MSAVPNAQPMNELDKKLEKLAHHIYSVNAFRVVCECGPLGNYEVAPLKSGEKYAVTRIRGFRILDDEGDQKYKPRDIPGAEICKDIVERNPGLGLICYPEGNTGEPSEDDLETAREALREADRQRLLWGDHIWEKTHDRALISGEWTRAARRLDAKREWAADFKIDEQKECPACGEYIKSAAKKCKHCGEWLTDEPPAKIGVVPRPLGKR